MLSKLKIKKKLNVPYNVYINFFQYTILHNIDEQVNKDTNNIVFYNINNVVLFTFKYESINFIKRKLNDR